MWVPLSNFTYLSETIHYIINFFSILIWLRSSHFIPFFLNSTFLHNTNNATVSVSPLSSLTAPGEMDAFDNFAGNETGIVDALKSAYDYDISKLDPWVGTLAERAITRIDGWKDTADSVDWSV